MRATYECRDFSRPRDDIPTALCIRMHVHVIVWVRVRVVRTHLQPVGP
jgi:hypothetical protein